MLPSYDTTKARVLKFLCILVIIFIIFGAIQIPIPVKAETKGTHVVDSMLDTNPASDANPGDGVCKTSSNVCTLRAAIEEANASSGSDTITFDSSVTSVILQTALPALTDTSGGTTILGKSDNVYIIGTLTASGTNGFVLTSNNNKIQGLDIVGFSGNGIVINGDNNTIGTNGDGTNDSVEDNFIRNNGKNGILVNTGADNNRISGNMIGLNRTGGVEGNAWNGIDVMGSNNRIGVHGNNISDNLEGNSIIGNAQNGITVTNGGNIISGNKIRSNTYHGISVTTATGTLIGTNGDNISDALEGNLISANFDYGIQIYNSSDNKVSGNKIGTNETGDDNHNNYDGGIYLWDTTATYIGTDGSGSGAGAEGNLISGNHNYGIRLYNSQGNYIAGNKIGTDNSGTLALENTAGGIFLDRSYFNYIGTDGDGTGDTIERNLISGNGGNGIDLAGIGSEDNFIAGNIIGLDISGTTPIPNENNGVKLSIGANENIVGTNGDGTSDVIERNIISGNTECGVSIGGERNLISGNYIGTNGSGTTAVANTNYGVCISNAINNTIGSNGDGKGDLQEWNVISGNNSGGVYITTTGLATNANLIQGNFIGTNASGTSALGNIGPGVYLNNVVDNRVGFPTESLKNVIAYNTGPGIVFIGTTNLIGNQFTGNSIYSNSFGIDLGYNGVTSNDTGDGDTGPNGLLNYPVITGAESTGDSISLAVSYSSKASKPYVLEFFWSRNCDVSGFGQGEVYLGWDSVTTDASGSVIKQIGLPYDQIPSGFITGVALVGADNTTSEFSQCIAIEGTDQFSIFLPLLNK